MRLLLALLLLLMPIIAGAEPLVYRGEQTLWQDTAWEGDVLVDGILTVAPGVTLEIRPGTVVRFTRMDSNHDGIGEHELFIQGTFIARGTAELPVVFTSAETNPARGDWGAINMMVSTAENVLEHCQVEFGYRGFHAHFAAARLSHSTFRNNWRGAQFQESTVTIDACRFDDNFNGLQFRDSTVSIRDCRISNNYWGVRGVYTTLDMSNCTIEKNLINGLNLRDSEVVLSGNRVNDNRRGVYLQRSSGRVDDNLITGNSEHGIFLEDSDVVVEKNLVSGNGRAGFRVLDSTAAIVDNDIIANDEYGLINDGTQDLRIVGNWWGTVDVDALAALIRDGADRDGVGRVHLEQPLAASARE